MTCPSCNKPKTNKDFYWRGDWKVYKECRECVCNKLKRARKDKRKVKEGIFSIEVWGRENKY